MWNITVFKKIHFNYAIFVFLPLVLLCSKAFASCQPAVPVTLPGVNKTVYVSRDNISDPIMRGDYLLSTITVNINCTYNDEGPNYRLNTTAAGSISPNNPFGSDFSGHTAVALEGNGLGLEVYESPNGGTPVWFGDFLSMPRAGFPASQHFTAEFGVYLVSLQGSLTSPGIHSFYGVFGIVYVQNNSFPVSLGNFSINVVLTGCQLNTNQANLTWNTISSPDIISGEVATRTAEIGADCGEVETPVSIKFSSSRGYVNAAQGIVRTDEDGSNNMGLQLTWEKDGQPIAMDKTTQDSVKGIKQFNVVAKPVAINPKNSIKSGNYDGTVTMMFSYR